MPDKSKDKSKASKDIKEQLLTLLMSDKDLLAKIVEAVTSCIIEKLLHSEDVQKSIAVAVIDSVEFKESVTKGRQEIYDSVSFDLGDSHEELNSLKEHCNNLERSFDSLSQEIDNLEQYSRRNCLLVHGVKEQHEMDNTPGESREDTDELVRKALEKLHVDISPEDLDRSHRIGKKTTNKNRPIIVKFTRYKKRNEVFRAKRNLKKTGITITESLTALRLQLLKEAQTKEDVTLAWTSDGRIICLLKDMKTKFLVKDRTDLDKLGKSVVKPRRSRRGGK